MTESRFNLIEEPWIPVAGCGKVSLSQIFSNPSYRALGGDPVQKIALMKLLLAIAQAAHTPEDNRAWADLQPTGMAQHCLRYLEQWHDRFYLYGDAPFLQIPAIQAAEIFSYGSVMLEVASGNTTVLTQSQQEHALNDADRALLLIQLMGFGIGGKADNKVVLSVSYQGKSNDKGNVAVPRAGICLGSYGFLHNFIQGDTVWHSLWCNMLTHRDISEIRTYPNGLGIAPWERMPVGEDCDTAKALRGSLIGRLVPLTRFCLFVEKGTHCSEGIAYLDYKDGVTDPSISANFSGKDPKALWVKPDKRPWRQLTSLLSFIAQSQTNKTFDCLQLRLPMERMKQHIASFGVWSGGVSISSNSGKQYFSGSDDFVESTIQLQTSYLDANWFNHLQAEMDALDALSKTVYGATFGFYKSQNMESKGQAEKASHLFWQLCEQEFGALLAACDEPAKLFEQRKVFTQIAERCYNLTCARDTARQLDAWAKNRPNFSKYLKNLVKEAA